jgi:predicted alpha/beta hydrolase family esterase
MPYEILLIQGAGNVTIADELVIVEQLKRELGDDFTVIYPIMPDADQPSYHTWETVLAANLEKLPVNVILLGHSLGASVILKHFSKHDVPNKVLGMVLFGVPYWKNQNWDVSEYEIEEELVPNLSKLENVYFYHSADDEVIPYVHLEAYQKILPQANWRITSGLDHSYHGAISLIANDIKELASKSK